MREYNVIMSVEEEEIFINLIAVTAPCDQQNFLSFKIFKKKFDDFLKNSLKSDVALKHEFTGYQSRKIIKSVHEQSPRGGKKKRNVEKKRETS